MPGLGLDRGGEGDGSDGFVAVENIRGVGDEKVERSCNIILFQKRL